MSATTAAAATSPDDSAMTSSGDGDGSRVLRLGSAKSNFRVFASFTRRPRRNADDPNNSDLPDYHANSISTGFFKNIKKRLRIKNFSLCKAKQKVQSIDSQHQSDKQGENAPPSSPAQLERRLSFAGKPPEAATADADEPRLAASRDSDDWIRRLERNGVAEDLLNEADACWESYGALGARRDDAGAGADDSERDLRLAGESSALADRENDEEADDIERIGNVAEPQSTTARESVAADADDGDDDRLHGECKAKVNLSEELLKLSKYGWYWGPISGDEADSKLVSEPDGAFLVRDSSDDRYLLTLSFKSLGQLLHARMDHSGGLFSLCNQSENEGFTSVPALIDHSMSSSQSAVFCYSRPRYPGYPSFPVRLTKPVSRFTQVRSLQYLCRFVIRQNTRIDNIHKLPLPKTIKGYIEEAHY